MHESTTVGIFQQINVALDLVAGPTRHRHRRRRLPDRPLRRRGSRPPPQLRDPTRPRRSRRRRRRGALTRRLPNRRSHRPRGRDGTGGGRRRHHRLGSLPCGRRARPRPSGGERRTRRGMYLQVPQRRAGRPAFVFVSTDVQQRVVQPIWGWFAQTDQFAMERPFDPRAGIGRMLNGTPPVLGLTAAREGIALTAEAGIAAVAEKARAPGRIRHRAGGPVRVGDHHPARPRSTRRTRRHPAPRRRDAFTNGSPIARWSSTTATPTSCDSGFPRSPPDSPTSSTRC